MQQQQYHQEALNTKNRTVLLLLTTCLLSHRVNAVLDVASKLYDLEQQHADEGMDNVPQIVLLNVPSSLLKRLAEKSVKWNALSGYLQRALLWDSGLVMTSTGRLVQVYTPCTEPMSVVLTTFEAFRGKDCPLETCAPTGLYFADLKCSQRTVWKAAQCGIAAVEKNETDVVDAESTTLWSEDGDLTVVPDIQLYKHMLRNSSGSDDIDASVGSASTGKNTHEAGVLFTINQVAPLPSATKECPDTPFFVAPCVELYDTEMESWCLPNRGGFVDLWLDSEISIQSMSSSSSANAVASTKKAAMDIHGATIILIVLLILLVAAVGVLVAVQKKWHETHVEASPTIYDSMVTTRPQQKNCGTVYRPSTPRNSINKRRSIELATFCIDAKITAKRIAYDSLSFDKLIARGANGEVWRGTCGSQVVAIKQLLPEKRYNESDVRLFSHEIQIASALEHPTIVRFVGLSWNRACDLCIVSEFMEQGDLSVLLKSARKEGLSWFKEKLAIAIDIADALTYLHGREPIIIHRDLKSLNVLLDNHLRAKLSDFGLSRERSSDDTMTNGVGTLLWTAPEILRGEAYSEKADVYSYAIVLSELDTCLPPFALNAEVRERRLTSMQLMHLATSGEISPQLREDCPVPLQQLTAACASFDPSQRPNALEIVFTLRNIARSVKFDASFAASSMPVRRHSALFQLPHDQHRLYSVPCHSTLVLLCLLLFCGQCRATGDLVMRLYDLEQSGHSTAKLSLSSSELPSAVTSRLSSYSLAWNEISGFMQRALLWDSGFVFASSSSASMTSSSLRAPNVTLVQIYTACSKGMEDLLPSLAEIKTLAKNSSAGPCEVQNCGSIGHFLAGSCPLMQLLPLTRCAVYASAMGGQEQVKSVVWAEDGRSTSVPAPVLRRHTAVGTEASRSLFAVHLSEAIFTGTESCQPYTDFIVPCRGMADNVRVMRSSDSISFIDNSSSLLKADLCPASHGALMDAWLKLESMPSAKTFSTLAIGLLAAFVLISVALAISVCWLSRSRARLQNAYDQVMLERSWDDGCWSPNLHLMGGPLGSSVIEEERLTPMEVFFGAQLRNRRSPGVRGTPALVATTRAEITLSNDQLCRESTILRAFVSDPAIVTRRISFAQLHFLRLLAKGGSGEVWLGQYETRYVAMKCLLPVKREDPEALERFAEEIRMASLLAHPRIVAFCGVAWQSLLHLCAVTEYMPRGDLESLLANPIAWKELSWSREKLTLSSDIAEALVYLHSLVSIVIHRDLKSKNVLLDRRLRAKLSDFGLSREQSIEDTMTNGIGTILWSAPEVLEGKRYDEKSDLFSFGVVLSEIDTCALPYGFSRHARMRSMQIVHLVSEGKLLPSFRDDCPPPIRALAQRCLSLDPAARPTAMEVAFELRSFIAPQLLQQQVSTVAGGDSGSVIPSTMSLCTTDAGRIESGAAQPSTDVHTNVIGEDANDKQTQTEPCVVYEK